MLLQDTVPLKYALMNTIFSKNSPKKRMYFDKPCPKNATRNSKTFPATQLKKQPNCVGKPPNWQHWWTGSTALSGLKINVINKML